MVDVCWPSICVCVGSFRPVCAVSVYHHKLSPVTGCRPFWSPECRIQPRSRAATSKRLGRLLLLNLSGRAPRWVSQIFHIPLWTAHGYQSSSSPRHAILMIPCEEHAALSFMPLSLDEHLLWHEQPGDRLFRLFAPGAWLTLKHYIRFYLVPIPYHAL